jgi:hypothetical protein
LGIVAITPWPESRQTQQLPAPADTAPLASRLPCQRRLDPQTGHDASHPPQNKDAQGTERDYRQRRIFAGSSDWAANGAAPWKSTAASCTLQQRSVSSCPSAKLWIPPAIAAGALRV